MAVFRVEKNSGYTVMSNNHLRNRNLSLKAKGLLSQISANGSYRKMNKDGKAWTARLSHVVYRMTPTTLERPYLNPDWVEWLRCKCSLHVHSAREKGGTAAQTL